QVLKGSTFGSFARGREHLDEGVHEGLAFVERLDEDAFVAAVEANVVAVDEDALDAVGGNASGARAAAVGAAHNHGGNHSDAGPDFLGDLASRVEHIGAKRRGEGGSRIADDVDGDLIVVDNFAQRAGDEFDGVFGQHAAVDISGGELRQRVQRVAAFEHR